MDLFEIMVCEAFAVVLLYLAGSNLIDHFFHRQGEIINRMTEKGDV